MARAGRSGRDGRPRVPRVLGSWAPLVLVCAALLTAGGVGEGWAVAQGSSEPEMYVGLGVDDLPAGFREVAPEDLVAGTYSVGTTAEALAAAFAGAALEESRVFGSADDSEIVEVLLVGPLTPAEQTMLDLQFADTEGALEALTSAFIMFVDMGDPQSIDTGDLGASAFAYTTTLTLTSDLARATNALGHPWTANRVEAALARRGEHLIVVGVSRAGGGEPSVHAVDLAGVVDGRLAAYLGEDVGGFRTADTLVPELTTHIPTPLDVSVDPEVVGANLLLAAAAMMFFVAAEELLRRTMSAGEGRLQRVLAPSRWLARG